MPKNKYIVRENSSGKTRELLEFAKENNLIVICRDAAAMERKAQAYGIYGVGFISYEEIARENRIYEGSLELNVPFVVDEVESFLSFLFANDCRGFTQTIE